MTNTTYFHSVYRSDTESISSSSEHNLEIEEGSVVIVEAPSLYSVLGKAFLACARPATDNQSTISETDELVNGLSSEDTSYGSEDVSFVPTSEEPKLKRFRFEELKTATKNFRLNAGCPLDGNWSVSKAWIDEHTLTPTMPGTGTPIAVAFVDRQWLEELEHFGKLSHPNLVRLFGYCLYNNLSLLVYEFIRRESLVVSWSLRMKIALGAAKGLAFLHRENVIYHDFSSSNILLDKSYNAKLSNYWFPKEIREYDGSSTATRGYIGHITAESNVYKFGVVLLEILSRRRAFDPNRPFGEMDLVEWAKPYLSDKRKIFRVLDEDLHGQCSVQSAQKVAQLLLQCLAMEAKSRPSMDMVVISLEQLQDKPNSSISF